MSSTRRFNRPTSVVVLGGVAVLAAGLCWQALAKPPEKLPDAFDAGKQRLAIIQELQKANKHLAEIAQSLREMKAEKDGQKK